MSSAYMNAHGHGYRCKHVSYFTLTSPDRIRVSDRSRAAIETTADDGDTFRFDCFDVDDASCFVGAAAGAVATVAAGLSSISLVHLRLL